MKSESPPTSDSITPETNDVLELDLCEMDKQLLCEPTGVARESGCGRLKIVGGGAVAQLGARLDGIEEVVGSNPIGSTISSSVQSGDILYRTFLRHSLHFWTKGVV